MSEDNSFKKIVSEGKERDIVAEGNVESNHLF